VLLTQAGKSRKKLLRRERISINVIEKETAYNNITDKLETGPGTGMCFCQNTRLTSGAVPPKFCCVQKNLFQT